MTMMYALRLWVNGRIEDRLETPDASIAMARFRDIVREWPDDWAGLHWSVTVNAEPGPYPERSWTIASYQHAGTN